MLCERFTHSQTIRQDQLFSDYLEVGLGQQLFSFGPIVVSRLPVVEVADQVRFGSSDCHVFFRITWMEVSQRHILLFFDTINIIRFLSYFHPILS